MMVDVADDEQPRPDRPGPPPAPRETPPPPSPQGGLPPSVPGESFDAEQWRRFQEFQKFQEFKRFEQAHPPPPPASTKPMWKKLLLNKWARRLVVALLVLLAAQWALDHYFGNPDDDLPASETGGHKTARNLIRAESPGEGVLLFYLGVAEGGEHTCNGFETEELANRFAQHFNAPTCPVAIQRLHEEVTDPSSFAWPLPGSVDYKPRPDGSVVVSSCDLEVRGGPRLGEFTFRVIPGSVNNQWIITDHRKEAADCR